jgi:hypothetical protein
MDPSVMVTAPAPQLTITVEQVSDEPELHLHGSRAGTASTPRRERPARQGGRMPWRAGSPRGLPEPDQGTPPGSGPSYPSIDESSMPTS